MAHLQITYLWLVLTAVSEQSSSKSATIEMYAPSSYNETVTGETLSSVSEKSESYSNGDSNQEYLVSLKQILSLHLRNLHGTLFAKIAQLCWLE
jgi:hypothetical protein